MNCTRRHFFSSLGRALLEDACGAVEALRSRRSAGASDVGASGGLGAWLRPPGALPEEAFLTACTRCTACQEACPHHSIRRLGPEFAHLAGTPAIIPRESPCYLCEDMPCVAACEPRALVPVARSDVRMGRAVIAESACYVAQGQPCDYCVARCPLRSDAIRFDGRGIPVVMDAGCVGCGVCAYLCPAEAITVVPANKPPSVRIGVKDAITQPASAPRR